MLNFFTTIDQSGAECFPGFTRSDCRGADGQDEFDRQFEKLVTAMVEMDADVFGLVEIENNYADGPNSAIQTLVDAINADGRSNCDRYAAVNPGVDKSRRRRDRCRADLLLEPRRTRSPDAPGDLDDAELERLAEL